MFKRIRMWIGLEKIAAYWRSQGHPLPHAAAMDEVHQRAELERFRDFVSHRVTNGDALLDDLKAEYIETQLARSASAADWRRLSLLKRIIKQMSPAEMLHPRAYEIWRKKCKLDTTAEFPEHVERVLLRP